MSVWKIGIGVAAFVAIAAVSIGIVGAQTDDDGNGPLGNFVARLAENLGITQDELEAAIDETQLEIVDEKLADGAITDEQAANAREHIESGESFFGAFGQRGHKMQMRGGGFYGSANIAEFIGITPEELHDAIQSGQSVVQVAAANGISEQALTDFLLGEIETKLAEAVESGRIDQAQADEILAGAADKIAEHINREGPLEKPDGFGALHEGDSPHGEFSELQEGDFPHGGFGDLREGEGRFPGGFGRFRGHGGGFPQHDSTGVTEAVSPIF